MKLKVGELSEATVLKALNILKKTTDFKPLSARKFTKQLYPDKEYKGHAPWLCGANIAGKLIRSGLVGRTLIHSRYYITEKGKELIKQKSNKSWK